MGLTPRYRHWMSPATEGLWPTAILCVDCTSTVVQCVGPIGTHREQLTGWCGAILMLRDGRYDRGGEVVGTAALRCLEEIRHISDTEAVLWVVSNQCQRVWSLLGLWEDIEDGRIQVCSPDYRGSQAFRDRLREYRRRQDRPLRPVGGGELGRIAAKDSGYLVLEDPPNILRGRFYGSRHSTTWIDIRNHGLEPPSGVAPGQHTASWLADTVQRMCQLCREHGLTALKPTAASQAMSAWRHSYLSESVHVHTEQRTEALEQRAYYGGRCEATRVGHVGCPVYHVDFVSQYGYVCAQGGLPVRLVGNRRRNGGQIPPGERVWDRLIADVTVETEEPTFPLRREGAVIYPTGRFRTVLCGPELAKGALLDRIVAVHEIAEYDLGNPLSAYADSLYAVRQDEERLGNVATAQWAKRLIVSLPGKLGQLNHRWVDCPHIMPQTLYGEWYGQDEDGELVRYRSLGGLVQMDVVDGYAADSVPAIAAFVTSYGRVRLLRAIRIAGWANVYYYDTDSLMVNEEGYRRLLRSEFMASSGMGFLTLRGVYEAMEIRGVKYYVSDGKVTCSGLAKGQIVDGGDGVHYSRYLSAVEQSRRGHRPVAAIITGSYVRAEAYGGGIVSADGKVKPFHLRE
jgi:hypothetical protein